MSSVYGPHPAPSAVYGVASDPSASTEAEASRRSNKTMLVAGVIFGAIAAASLIGIAFVANPIIAVGLFCISMTAAVIALPLLLVALMPSSTSSCGYVNETHHTDVVVVGSPPVRHSPSVVFVDGRRSPPPAYVSPYPVMAPHSVSSRLPPSDGIRMGNPLRGPDASSRGHGGYAVVNSHR